MTGLIFGWVMVQVLSMLVGEPRFTDQDKEKVIETAENIANVSIVERLWLVLFFVGRIVAHCIRSASLHCRFRWHRSHVHIRGLLHPNQLGVGWIRN